MSENWLMEAAQRFRQQVETASPPRDPWFDKGAITEPFRLAPDPKPEAKVFPCIACGRDVAKKHTYCPDCRDLVEQGIDVEIGSVPTENECRAALGWARGKRKKANQ